MNHPRKSVPTTPASSIPYRPAPINSSFHASPQSLSRATSQSEGIPVSYEQMPIYSYEPTSTLIPKTTTPWPSAVLYSRAGQLSSNVYATENERSSQSFVDMASPYSPAMYSTQSTRPLPSTSPSPSYLNSQRPSVSVLGTETYGTPEAYQNYDLRVKMEEPLEWLEDQNGPYTMSQARASIMTPSSSSYRSGYTVDYSSGKQQRQEDQRSPDRQSTGVSSSITTDRQSEYQGDYPNVRRSLSREKFKRKTTAAEDANFKCKVPGCGKFFNRSYNYRAHMETHDSGRVYPFPCPIEGCTKKFVRKTDLNRHHQSVHMKDRSHQCEYCNRFFSRKDTLRRYISKFPSRYLTDTHRHRDDGCSKRYDVPLDFDRSAASSSFDDLSQGAGTMPPDDPSQLLGTGRNSNMTQGRMC
jgi:hypothetical protein